MPKPQNGPFYDPTYRGGMGVLTEARASQVDPIHLPAELANAHPLDPAPASYKGSNASANATWTRSAFHSPTPHYLHPDYQRIIPINPIPSHPSSPLNGRATHSPTILPNALLRTGGARRVLYRLSPKQLNQGEIEEEMTPALHTRGQSFLT
jgi:hypothetical protein